MPLRELSSSAHEIIFTFSFLTYKYERFIRQETFLPITKTRVFSNENISHGIENEDIFLDPRYCKD